MLDPEEVRRTVDDLRVARSDLGNHVDKLMEVTDRLVALIIELIKATRGG